MTPEGRGSRKPEKLLPQKRRDQCGVRMLVERNTRTDPSKISRIGASRATLKPSWSCADESVSVVACLVAVTGGTSW